MRREPWKLKDVVMMAILGVLFAVVYMAVFYGGTAISVALTPLGLSAFGFELIYGVWFMAATIAAYIIRKPGAALITEVLASAIELLMGNSGGATVVLTGLIQGVGCELGFAVFRYRKYNLLSMALIRRLCRRVHLLLRAVLPELLSAGPHHAGRPVGRPLCQRRGLLRRHRQAGLRRPGPDGGTAQLRRGRPACPGIHRR